VKEKIFTNCFLVRTDRSHIPTYVCLALKKRGFGAGMWNGAGGKPEGNETVEAAAIREVQEELSVKVNSLEKRGEINFVLVKESKLVLMHTFLATDWIGKPVETEEMKPQWFAIDKVPYSKMWASDKEWLRVILSDKKIKAKYTYLKEGGELLTSELEEVLSFTPRSD